jgi:hypothetical protein
MRKTIVGLVAAACLTMATLGGAAANGQGPSECSASNPSSYIVAEAQQQGISGNYNPGNAKNSAKPYVPDTLGCNPTW